MVLKEVSSVPKEVSSVPKEVSSVPKEVSSIPKAVGLLLGKQAYYQRSKFDDLEDRGWEKFTAS